MSGVEHDKGIVFLHTVSDGPASQSYGLQVAQLAGVPPSVIRAARKRLAELERQSAGQTRQAIPQLDLFAPRETYDPYDSDDRAEPGWDRVEWASAEPRTPYHADVSEPGLGASTNGAQITASGSRPHATATPPHHSALLERLAGIQPDELRPKEALDLLYELRALYDASPATADGTSITP